MSHLLQRGGLANPQGSSAGRSTARDEEDSNNKTDKRFIIYKTIIKSLNPRINGLEGSITSITAILQQLQASVNTLKPP